MKVSGFASLFLSVAAITGQAASASVYCRADGAKVKAVISESTIRQGGSKVFKGTFQECEKKIRDASCADDYQVEYYTYTSGCDKGYVEATVWRARNTKTQDYFVDRDACVWNELFPAKRK